MHADGEDGGSPGALHLVHILGPYVDLHEDRAVLVLLVVRVGDAPPLRPNAVRRVLPVL